MCTNKLWCIHVLLKSITVFVHHVMNLHPALENDQSTSVCLFLSGTQWRQQQMKQTPLHHTRQWRNLSENHTVLNLTMLHWKTTLTTTDCSGQSVYWRHRGPRLLRTWSCCMKHRRRFSILSFVGYDHVCVCVCVCVCNLCICTAGGWGCGGGGGGGGMGLTYCVSMHENVCVYVCVRSVHASDVSSARDQGMAPCFP